MCLIFVFKNIKVMETHNAEIIIDSTERDFREFIRKGDDFFKIELLRQARSWYKKALLLNVDNHKVEVQIDECNRLLAYENRIVRIILVIASVLIAGILILK
jgi:hypothetical protein